MDMDEKSLTKTDEELVKLSLEDQKNFLYLIKKYEHQLLVYITRITNLPFEEAEDILQESFIKIYYNLNSFNPKLKFSSWAYRITHNEAMDELRKRKRRPMVFLEDKDWDKLSDQINLEEKTDKKILKENIKKSLEEIPVKYKEALVLKFLEDKDYKEISDILKKPIGSVGTLINRGKKLLKKQYGRYE